jgi:hypothetical protein
MQKHRLHQRGQSLAQDLFFLPAVHRFGRPVPALDAKLGVSDHDGIGDHLDNINVPGGFLMLVWPGLQLFDLLVELLNLVLQGSNIFLQTAVFRHQCFN